MFKKRERTQHRTAYTGVGQNSGNSQQPNPGARAAALSIGNAFKQQSSQPQPSTSRQSFGSLNTVNSSNYRNGSLSTSRNGSLLQRGSRNSYAPPVTQQPQARVPNSGSRRYSLGSSITSQPRSNRPLNSAGATGRSVSRGSNYSHNIDDSFPELYAEQGYDDDHEDSSHAYNMANMRDLKLPVTAEDNFQKPVRMVKKYVPSPTGIKVIEVPESSFDMEIKRSNSMRMNPYNSRSNSLRAPAKKSASRSGSLTSVDSKNLGRRTISSATNHSQAMGSLNEQVTLEDSLGKSAERVARENKLKALEEQIAKEKELEKEVELKRIEYERLRKARLDKEKELEKYAAIQSEEPNVANNRDNTNAAVVETTDVSAHANPNDSDAYIIPPAVAVRSAEPEVKKTNFAETHTEIDNDTQTGDITTASDILLEVQEPHDSASRRSSTGPVEDTLSLLSEDGKNMAPTEQANDEGYSKDELSEVSSESDLNNGMVVKISLGEKGLEEEGNDPRSSILSTNQDGIESVETLSSNSSGANEVLKNKDAVSQDANPDLSQNAANYFPLDQSTTPRVETTAADEERNGDLLTSNSKQQQQQQQQWESNADTRVSQANSSMNSLQPPTIAVNSSSKSSLYSDDTSPKRPLKSAMKSTSFSLLPNNQKSAVKNVNKNSAAHQAYLSLTTAENTRLNSSISTLPNPPTSRRRSTSRGEVYNLGGVDGGAYPQYSNPNVLHKEAQRKLSHNSLRNSSVNPNAQRHQNPSRGGNATGPANGAGMSNRTMRNSTYVQPIKPHPALQPNYVSPSKLKVQELYAKAQARPYSNFAPLEKTSSFEKEVPENQRQSQQPGNTAQVPQKKTGPKRTTLRSPNPPSATQNHASRPLYSQPQNNGRTGNANISANPSGYKSRFNDSDDDLPGASFGGKFKSRFADSDDDLPRGGGGGSGGMQSFAPMPEARYNNSKNNYNNNKSNSNYNTGASSAAAATNYANNNQWQAQSKAQAQAQAQFSPSYEDQDLGSKQKKKFGKLRKLFGLKS